MNETLKTVSDGLAEIVERVSASLIRVEARKRLPASGIAWSEDGLIITSHHVVQRDENIQIGLPSGETVTATLVGRDPSTDLALLRAEARLNVPNWVTEGLRVGHMVLALGRPGNTAQATQGIISALGDKAWRTPNGGDVDFYLQTDVVMYPGFSGGPLVDVSGRVVGLNTSALMRGVSLTLPVATLSRVASALAEHGHIKRGYLGVGAQPARLPEGLAEELSQETGLLIVTVEGGSPADQGGLLMGDTIIGLDGQAVRSLDELLSLLSSERVGREVAVRIMRGGELHELGVVIGERA
ncbi:MAG: PDZ domain-containing protein [Chloroflexi bacterium]|nr:PDZ domain-containing protein [Chloroflexota bacterium]